MSTPSKSPPDDPVLEITTSILTEAAHRPWLAALLMRRKPYWLTRLAHLAQRVRDLPRHTRRTLRRKLASGLAAAALLLALAGPPPMVYAAGITVDGDGTVGTCSLVDAITSANTDTATGYCPAGSGDDAILLTVDVNLTAALPSIDSEITIEGDGHTISGNNTVRVLQVNGGASLILRNATISDGIAGSTNIGGGILNNGTLTVSNSDLSGNTAYAGGGIANYGTLTVSNSTLSGNTANYWNGGGIYNGYGGNATIENSTLSGNTAYRDGGGIYNSNTLTVTNSTLSTNTASSGGGIANAYGGDTTVTNSTLSGNAANNSTEGAANGGGIVNYGGSLLVQNSTISGNTAEAIAGVGRGGGISNYSGTLTVSTSTIADNNAYGYSTSEGGGIHGTAMIDSSIVADNRLGPVVYNDCASYLSSGGYNIESGESCGFTATGDQQNVASASLNLQPLANNGVNPHPDTHALGPGSVAIDQIPDGISGCVAGVSIDERGAVRAGGVNRGGAACDIGAYEDSAETPLPVTLHDFTASTATATGVTGVIGAALTLLGALMIGRRRATVKQRING